jgi:hypothetical protein
MYVGMYVCMYVCMYMICIWMDVCMYVGMYVYMYVCMYVYMCILCACTHSLIPGFGRIDSSAVLVQRRVRRLQELQRRRP